MSRYARIQAFWQKFKKAQKGTTAIVFGIVVIPLLALGGGAVDYGYAMKTKAQLTTTLDAAVLAALLQYSIDDQADYKQIVNDYVNKNLTEAQKTYLGGDVTVTVPDIGEDGELRAALATTVKTNFLGLVGFDQFDVSVKSGAKVGGSKLELALVLDNTGSMAGSKIVALKDAAKDLVNVILPNGTDENIKIALVPFADYVNIGMANRSEPGLDIPDDFTISTTVPAGEKCWNEYPDSTHECTNNPYEGTCYNDGVPYDCLKNDWTCTGEYGDPVQHCNTEDTTTETNFSWCGAMASRPHDLNVRDDGYGTGVPGLMSTSSSWCSAISPLTRLTSNKGTIISSLNAMKSERNTYIPSGLAWGWRALSSTTPFADGAPYSDDSVKKVIVLMTDGSNTKSMRKRSGDSVSMNAGEVWDHQNSNTAEANTYTSELCSNIKNKDIMVFTIAFDVDPASDVQTLLQGCAGNGGKYFNADDDVELADAFKEIGLSLLNLRLSM